MNYYNRGIINYLINIGFTSATELVKQKVYEYKNDKITTKEPKPTSYEPKPTSYEPEP